MIYNSFESPGLVKVLTFLKAHDTEYLSGQDLSDVLRISRVAVWKHVKKIRELGYSVESRQKLGYKLVASPDAPLPWEITAGLKTRLLGKRAYYHDSVDSTQSQALKMAGEPENNGAIIVAARQTAGRGRGARRWLSPRGGIWFSVILQPVFDISVTTLFPMASALALSKALEKTFKIAPELKWPNDITINGKKLAGVLVDASLESNRVSNLVLGVGINFDVDVRQAERELQGTPNFYGVASLDGQKKNVKRVHLIRAFLIELEEIHDLLVSGKTRKIVSEWTQRSSTVGKRVELYTRNGKITGKAVGIDDDGALVLDNARNDRVIAGDVVHLSK